VTTEHSGLLPFAIHLLRLESASDKLGVHHPESTTESKSSTTIPNHPHPGTPISEERQDPDSVRSRLKQLRNAQSAMSEEEEEAELNEVAKFLIHLTRAADDLSEMIEGDKENEDERIVFDEFAWPQRRVRKAIVTWLKGDTSDQIIRSDRGGFYHCWDYSGSVILGEYSGSSILMLG
jgi:hypothetical protein